MRPFIQASVSSALLCGLMVLFAFASDSITIADEPALLTAAIVADQQNPRGETPIEPENADGSLLPDHNDLFGISSAPEPSLPPEDSQEGGSADPASEESALSGSIPEGSDLPSSEPPSDPSSASSSESSQTSESAAGVSSSSAPPVSFTESEASETAPPSIQEPSAVSPEPPSSLPVTSSEPSSLPVSSEPSSSAISEPSSSSEASSAQSSSAPSSRPSSGETVTMRVNGSAQEMDLYTALCQVVEAEMGGSYHTEALKAQAVAAYSYIRYENARGAAASLPMRTPTQKTCDAVSAVLGEALYYGGSIAFTPYHASSAGWTNPAEEVWANGYSYLTRVESPHDPSSANRNVKAVFSAARVQSGLEKFLAISLDSEDPGSWLRTASVSAGGYVLSLEVTAADGSIHTLTGRQMRENVLSYGIRSHAFTVSWDGQQFIFITNGYGHGVGMSQTGAEGYAQDGWGYRQILAHYYPGTTIG